MTLPRSSIDPTYRIYIALIQYPILKSKIRAAMRRELFSRGIISPHEFEEMVLEQALQSQEREGLQDPYMEEDSYRWELRLHNIRGHLTDLFFANNLSYELFEELIAKILIPRGVEVEDNNTIELLNPEMMPQDMLFEQANLIKDMPKEVYRQYRPRLQEIKVILMRNLISDQLAYLNIAKEWIKLEDLITINDHRIGSGRIGGKSAGMILAQRILLEHGDQDIINHLDVPESYFLASDVIYAFMTHNNLIKWSGQKYKTEDEIRNDYPQILKEFMAGEFPPNIIEELKELIQTHHKTPLIVRSSSLLEDNFGMSFAGKYDSFFLPNQSTLEENLSEIQLAIAKVYASALNPDALLYRQSKRLQEYDERIAVLIQPVSGKKHKKFFFPHGAGVAFSRNLFRWSPVINKKEGFLRLVWGLGTRAVDRVGNDYPRLVALSHPLLHTHADPKNIVNYSQHYIDAIDLDQNKLVSIPVEQVVDQKLPYLRYVAQTYQNGYLSSIRSSIEDENSQTVITFDDLLKRTPFADRMKRILHILETSYQRPVDLEFTLEIENPHSLEPEVNITLLQCRPQSELIELKTKLPEDLEPKDILFKTHGVVPEGLVENIDYLVYVSPKYYYALPNQEDRFELGRIISKINKKLKLETFICIGPGRWGTVNTDLGVRIGYSDIHHTRALIEVSGKGLGCTPEPSFGTHFFQDLIEAQIYPLAINLDDPKTIYQESLFENTPNQLQKLIPDLVKYEKVLRIIKIDDIQKNHRLNLVMNDAKGIAVAYLIPSEK